MNRSNVRISKLYKEISDFGDFVLYGAGQIASELLGALDRVGLAPLYCVVTNAEGNPESVGNISVCGLSEKISELREKNVLVLVAVSDLYEKEIIHILLEKGISNIVSAFDYLWHSIGERTFYDIYMEKDFEWYSDRIEEWYFDQHGLRQNMPIFHQKKRGKKGRILFVVNNLSPRVVKIAKALKNCGKEVIIFQDVGMKNSYWVKFNSSLQEENIANIYYACIEELIYRLIQNKGDIIHIFSNGWNPYTSYILIKFRAYLGKVVFENYDILNGYYANQDEEKLRLERYCLENADGVCYREFSLEYLTDILGFQFHGKCLRFFDYCSDSKLIEKTNDKKEELSLCFAGGVETEEDWHDCPHGGFMELAKICEENKCHLYVYPSLWDEKKYARYIEKDKESRYFHFHKTVDYDVLVNELARYDYGIVPTRDNVWEKEISGSYTKYKYIYAATNKFFDYLDAGLPVIAGLPMKFVEYLEEKGVLINWTDGQYDFRYLVKMQSSMRKKVVEVQEELSIQNHICELIDFYESL